MNILGISAGFHDAGITLINDGEIKFAAHAERYSKRKHDSELNVEILNDCFNRYGVPQRIAYYERPWLKKTRQLYAGQYRDIFEPSIKHKLEQIWSRETMPKIEYYGHHLSHAAAGFQTSPFTDATVVVIDAIGEWDTITIWHAYYDDQGRAQYQKLWSRKYPHSIGLMYSAFTQQAGLRPLDEEYILMGMAGWGTRTNLRDLRLRKSLLSDEKDIIFKHNLHLGLTEDIVYPSDNMDMAASVQELTEDLISSVMIKASDVGLSSNLVYMGGVALNCSANRILGEYFDRIWIMPCPGDAGSSLGAAALAWGQRLDWRNAFLGYDITGPYPVKDILSQLVTNKIVGVASGRAEFGPRALGNRSLLADPRGPEIKDQVNEIKRRQKFRPFAPVILEELVHEYFDMPVNWDSSPYMQVVAHCRHPNDFPAIVHVDGTSRVQTVAKDDSGIRELLEAWYEWTGCPMLLNTSLNIRGEPMVNDRSDADRFEKLYGVRVLS
jgi:carbamoyltransferase